MTRTGTQETALLTSRAMAPSWPELVAETKHKRKLWARDGAHSREFVPCGRVWDAVAVQPMQLGVDVLVTMRLDPGFGYLIVADYLRGTLYVMIPPGSGGDAFDGMPGVRVLGRHHQLLMPRTVQHHSALADWVGVPDATSSALADPHQLAGCLRELAAGQERAAAA